MASFELYIFIGIFLGIILAASGALWGVAEQIKKNNDLGSEEVNRGHYIVKFTQNYGFDNVSKDYDINEEINRLNDYK